MVLKDLLTGRIVHIMMKQSGYQQLDTDALDAQEYGFAARLPQTGESCQANGANYAHLGNQGTGGEQIAYPAGTRAGAPVAGYPVMTPMAGPVGMVAQDPLGRMGIRDRKLARRLERGAAGGGCRRRRRGPVHSLVRLVRYAWEKQQDRKQQQAPPHSAGSSHL